ncbi:hypothetical protein EXIGLDRAFT_744597 [Exidia glandulosa HHB12029]|uniref:Uncharacterized protein n=1 Tax=Exidia glandulosa HHB12029 TaxID=1314781 RepID=A0A165PNN8_EXIGL|nr:hypothetical protein EXIGLDRAFT_744597 [Exidia glandulosa HHB12029]
MQFSALLTVVAAALSIGVSAAPAKRATLPLPTKASVWVQTQSGDTIAYLNSQGWAWQWATESSPGDGPDIAKFDIKLVPGSVQPSGDDALVKLAMNGHECSLVNEFLDCIVTDSPTAVFRAKVQTDVTGATHWSLLGGHPAFSLESYQKELKFLALTPDHGAPMNVYLRTDSQ